MTDFEQYPTINQTGDAKRRHIKLHRSLDELLACFITNSSLEIEGLRSERILDQPIRILLEYSYRACSEPPCAASEVKPCASRVAE